MLILSSMVVPNNYCLLIYVVKLIHISVLYRTEIMDDFEKRRAGYVVLTQQLMRLASKASAVIAVTALLQEAVNLNRQLSNSVAELVEDLSHERQSKNPDPNGGQVPREARPPAA